MMVQRIRLGGGTNWNGQSDYLCIAEGVFIGDDMGGEDGRTTWIEPWTQRHRLFQPATGSHISNPSHPTSRTATQSDSESCLYKKCNFVRLGPIDSFI